MEGIGARLSEIEIDGYIASIISQELLLIQLGVGSEIIADATAESIEKGRAILMAQYEAQ